MSERIKENPKDSSRARANTKTDTSSQKANKIDPKMSYTDAVEELQTILDSLKDDDVDVDDLTEKVERSYGLIQFCQSKISRAETQVSEIMADIEKNSKD